MGFHLHAVSCDLDGVEEWVLASKEKHEVVTDVSGMSQRRLSRSHDGPFVAEVEALLKLWPAKVL